MKPFIKLKITQFVLLVSLFNLALYHLPFFAYVNVQSGSFALCVVLGLFIFTTNFVFLFPLSCFFPRISKFLIIVLFNINAIAFFYFDSYSVILNKTMIGNIVHTNTTEASSFLSVQLLTTWFIFGVIPSIFIAKIKLIAITKKVFFEQLVIAFLLFIGIAYGASTQWIGWLNKNERILGSMLLPWSYLVNTPRYFSADNTQSREQILLPKASIKNNEKALFVLVIGESSSRESYSLYGYQRNTNPQLAKIKNLVPYYAESCDTYTMVGLKCILEHKKTDKLYEPLPSYLYRSGVDVVWRTLNDGEPYIQTRAFQNQTYFSKICSEKNCGFDEVILSDLQGEINKSNTDKMLLVLHLNPSHGSRYDTKYPKEFEKFTPVCHENDPTACEQQEVVNAYDNTIVYTDHILASLIKKLAKIQDRKVAMLYVSDHGESLGKDGVYFHAKDMSIAPKRQYQVPFMVWTSDNARKPKLDYSVKNGLPEGKTGLSQHNVFHSVLDFLAVDSPVFDKEKSVFYKNDSKK
ncbi:MAG: sulfatase-like hydrolase/transferase [Moraxellaceae bacterium]|nr:sulfatase-like hydrolase/transferase [Moraxellaceae bacterium]